MGALGVVGLLVLGAAGGLPGWEFDADSGAGGWQANAHSGEAAVRDGVYSLKPVDWDPFLMCRDVEFPATPWQVVRFRVRADKGGWCDLFWSGTFEGKYGGLIESKKSRFALKGTGEWETIAVFPFWQKEGRICQLRFDVYNGATFEIDWIRIEEWGSDEALTDGAVSWTFDGKEDSWRVVPGAAERFGPRLAVDVEALTWATLELTSDIGGSGAVLWGTGATNGLQSESFEVIGDGKRHVYNIEMTGIPTWRGPLVALGFRVPEGRGVEVHGIALSDGPSGPPDVGVGHLNFVDSPNRIGKACRVMARVQNRGGASAEELEVELVVPAGGGGGGTQGVRCSFCNECRLRRGR
ncbi:MAG: hypothetical protein GY851_21000 [bacterium]|nr:hypothetical protein [bacterium]